MKIPYPLVAAVPVEQRHAQMGIALQKGFPRLQKRPLNKTATLSIACYGPSLADTYQDLTHPILSMSGATRFLADRGVIADYHIDMDPRPHKVKHLDPPIPGVHYLMASVCPPETWDLLQDQQVTIWHGVSDHTRTAEWLAVHDPNTWLINGGSSIGLAALQIGGILGFEKFEIHGMDGSLRDGVRHCGPHFGHPQGGITWDAASVTYQTSRVMSNSIAEFLNMIRHFPMLIVMHGEGLTQALVREAGLDNVACADDTEKVARIRRATIERLDLPPFDPKKPLSFWGAMIDTLPQETLPDLLRIIAEAEPRRRRAHYNTGSIPLETALCLRALCHTYRPKVIAEIGTFIGTSTLAMQAMERIYTCDRDNDCFPAPLGIVTCPKQTSTDMLRRIVADGQTVDLFFFDGRIQPEDLSLIQALSHPKTIYAVDDYVEGQKGWVNAQILGPLCAGHALAVPEPQWHGRSTLAAFLPMGPTT